MNAGLLLKGGHADRKRAFRQESGEAAHTQPRGVHVCAREKQKKKRRQRGGETLRCPISALSKSACATSAADIKEETELTRGRDFAVLTAVLLVRVVSAVVLAVAPPVVRNAVVILAAEFMRSAGLFIFFHQEQTSKQRDENGFKGHEY